MNPIPFAPVAVRSKRLVLTSMSAGAGRFVGISLIRLAAEQEVPQVGGCHDEAAETGNDTLPGKPFGRGMRMFVPMTVCGHAKQGKSPDRKKENQKILVLPASQQDGQTGGRQDSHQHPLVKSNVGEKTTAQEGKGDQQNRHQQAMDSAHPSQGHRHAVQGETPSRDGTGYRSCWFLGHGDQVNLSDREKRAR